MKLPNPKQNKKPARLVTSFLIFIVFSITACNFPFRLGALNPGGSPTLDPDIFDARKTALAATQPIPGVSPVAPFPTAVDTSLYITYAAQSGDTLQIVAKHFGVSTGEVSSLSEIPSTGIIPPGQLLYILRTDTNTFHHDIILPDSAVIDSPCADGFSVADFVAQANGYLNYYEQKVGDNVLTGAQIVQRVADNTSVNPMLLLAIVELRSQWVYRYMSNPNYTYPLGLNTKNYEGLYLELSLAARMVNTGYYAWRQGEISEVTYTDLKITRIASNLNAGSAGIQYLFAQLYPYDQWENRLYAPDGLLPLYRNMFGDPWACAAKVEPMLTHQLIPPVLELPFSRGEKWALTGGLHPDWNTGTPFGALDFAPITGEARCQVSRAWVRASAPGLVTRSANSVVILSLEDENQQPTGWEVMYMHIAAQDRVAAGTRLKQDEPIGHPSCEGGASTGTHVHVTRKYRGEWIGAGDPFPFILSGWVALPGEQIFKSMLVKDGMTVTAHSDGSTGSVIIRE